jgi:hypothetical protein
VSIVLLHVHSPLPRSSDPDQSSKARVVNLEFEHCARIAGRAKHIDLRFLHTRTPIRDQIDSPLTIPLGTPRVTWFGPVDRHPPASMPPA